MNNMDNERKAYAEVDDFIELLEEEDRNKIPKKLRDFFKREKNHNYKKRINPDVSIEEQGLRDETLAIIAFLNLKYICEDEKEKERLKRIYMKNEEEK